MKLDVYHHPDGSTDHIYTVKGEYQGIVYENKLNQSKEYYKLGDSIRYKRILSQHNSALYIYDDPDYLGDILAFISATIFLVTGIWVLKR